MIKAAIAGGTGYTAGELLRILVNHPQVQIISVMSTTSAGEPVHSVHRELLGECDLKFTDTLGEPDVLFLCLGHGLSKEFLDNHNLPEHCKVIDLGNDFRLEDKYSGKQFVYGLCELNKEEIKKAGNIANPGCFATSILLGLIPLTQSGMLYDDIHITAITGSTGAGKKPTETSHFSYRDNNLSIYKLFSHQHLGEIKKTLGSITNEKLPQINFVPFRGDFSRGIFASIYTKAAEGVVIEELIEYYKKFYSGSPFVFVSDIEVSLKEVVNTNKCCIHIVHKNGQIHISSIIDNLVKGASGQAVQNMNLMFSLPEDTGLRLKANAF